MSKTVNVEVIVSLLGEKLAKLQVENAILEAKVMTLEQMVAEAAPDTPDGELSNSPKVTEP